MDGPDKEEWYTKIHTTPTTEPNNPLSISEERFNTLMDAVYDVEDYFSNKGYNVEIRLNLPDLLRKGIEGGREKNYEGGREAEYSDLDISNYFRKFRKGRRETKLVNEIRWKYPISENQAREWLKKKLNERDDLRKEKRGSSHNFTTFYIYSREEGEEGLAKKKRGIKRAS